MHGRSIYRVAHRHLGNDVDAWDCVQETLISVHRKIHQFEGRSSLGSWLHRVAVNHALMMLRSRERRRELSLDELIPAIDMGECRVEPPWSEPQPLEELAERLELQRIVRLAIDGLPKGHREAVLLKNLTELDAGEAARRLRVTPGALKTRLHRARALLRRRLELLLSDVEQSKPSR